MEASPGLRTVRVGPSRLEGWLDGFGGRHGRPRIEAGPDAIALLAPDGALARIALPWGLTPGADPLAELVESVSRPRRVGALIVRRKAHAVGVFEGDLLVAGRHGAHYVQGRTKAGGWSQQRYARRRANQAERSFDAAAEDAAAILLPEIDRLEALVTGGDRAAVTAVLAHPGLERLADPALRRGFGTFAVPDPNARVLAGFAEVFRQVSIELNELA